MTFDLIVIGFGNVARRFVRLLAELRPDLSREYDIETRVVGIATRSRGQVYHTDGLNATDLAAAVETGASLGPTGSTMAFLRAAIERSNRAAHEARLVLVETTTLNIEDGQPAIRHLREALRRGVHVITSNKGPAAFAYHSLHALAQRVDRCFNFESAVLDGVPVFNLKRATLPAVTVTGFRGVINSTTNYVLTAMEHGETFEGALSAMQRAGIAEADASLDIDGWDAAAKTAVLANTLLGARLTPMTIEREGVSAATSERVAAAQAVGRRLKLVASAERASGVVRGRVQLVELPETDLLAQLEGQQNAVILQTDLLGEIGILQRGWGLTPTAYGLVSDLVAVSREVKQTLARTQRLSSGRRGGTLLRRRRLRS